MISNRNRYTHTMGKLILFLFNSLQITLEMCHIAMVVGSYCFQWKGTVTCVKQQNNRKSVVFCHLDNKFSCGLMFARYLFFVILVNQCTFFVLSGIFSKLTKYEEDWGNYDRPHFYNNFTTFTYPILCWLWTIYDPQYILNISIQQCLQTSVTIISPMTYFYSIFKPGEG